MSIALLVITDGRDDCLDKAVASAATHLHGPITERWMFDDTGLDAYRDRLALRYPGWTHINGGPRQGFAGALALAWAYLATRSAADYVFHLEGDFTLNGPVETADMAAVLAARPYLAQLALRRQPVNAAEIAAGGVVQQHPDAFTEVVSLSGHVWLEQRLFFTTNPCLYRRSLCQVGWPTGNQSEGRFTYKLLHEGFDDTAAADVRFGYWGSLASGEWVNHIGHTRVGRGY